MIVNHHVIKLFDKKIFERGLVKPPFKNLNPMPNEACLLYVLEGSNNSYSEKEAMTVNKEEGVLMKCGNYIYEGISNKETGNFGFIAIHFYPEVLLKIYKNDVPGFLKNPSTDKFKRSMTVLKTDVLIRKYIEGLIFYFENPDIVTEELTVLKMKEIILLLLNSTNAPEVLEIMQNLFIHKSYSFKEVIESHIFSSITLQDLAKLTNKSLASFKREFKNTYNDSPANYIKNRRLERAASFLRLTDNSINHIAYDCQFTNLSHFSKSFKTKYNQSPSDYRMSQLHK